MDQKKAQAAPQMKNDQNKAKSEPNLQNSKTIASSALASSQPLRQAAVHFFAMKKIELDLATMSPADPKLAPRAEMFKELLESAGTRLGIMSRCALSDHDVHLIDEGQNIMAHFKLTDALPPGFENYRQMVLDLPPKFVALVIFANRAEAMLANGSTIPYP